MNQYFRYRGYSYICKDTSLFMLIDRLSSSLIDVEALLRHPTESASPSTNEEKKQLPICYDKYVV